jgi:hypothetical protein
MGRKPSGIPVLRNNEMAASFAAAAAKIYTNDMSGRVSASRT